MNKSIVTMVAMLTLATSAFAQIGSLDKDLVFTPVTPCRIMDTREPGADSGILTAGSVRSFVAWKTSYAAQGGSATNCGVLQSANTAAVLVNFTVVTPGTAGYITAFPADVLDANKPLAATVNFTAGSVIGNNATVKLNQSGLGYDFKIFSTSNTHVVADVVGFYSKPVATALECVEMTASASLLAGLTATLGTAICPAGYTITGGSCGSSSFEGKVISSRSFGFGTAYQSHSCTYKNEGLGLLNFVASANCCRIPGR